MDNKQNYTDGETTVFEAIRDTVEAEKAAQTQEPFDAAAAASDSALTGIFDPLPPEEPVEPAPSEEKPEEAASAPEEEAEEDEEEIRKPRTGLVIALIAAILVVGSVLAFLWIPAVRFVAANIFFSCEDYSTARSLYITADGYGNSKEMAADCKEHLNSAAYREAVELYETGHYDESHAAFEALGTYRDSRDWLILCDGGEELAQKNKDYHTAYDKMESGDYLGAAAIFETLNGHRDSAQRAAFCRSVVSTLTVNLTADGETVSTVSYTPSVLALRYDEDNWKTLVDTSSVFSCTANAALTVNRDRTRPEWHYSDDADAILATLGITGMELDVESLTTQVVELAKENKLSEPIDVPLMMFPCDDFNLGKLREDVCREAVDARYDPELKGATDSQTGVDFDGNAAAELLENAGEGETVTIPLTLIEPNVTKEDLDGVYFSCVIGEYSTGNLGNSNRTNNITLACKALNGIVVGPGEKLSYNVVVGERTRSRGYKEAGAYRNGESVQEIGGGICQVSSTLYNAVLLANLEILDRSCHVYPSSYCPMGLDATVSWGGPEFVFRNNSEYPLRIEAKVEGGKCIVRLIGTDDGLTVKMSYTILDTYPYETKTTTDPEKVCKTGHTGYRVVSYRTVYDANGNKISSKVEAYSYYSRQDIVELVEEDEDDDDPKTPDEPEKPDTPSEPEKPDTPTEPEKPDTPSEPEKPEPQPEPEPEPEPQPQPEPEPEPEPQPQPEPEPEPEPQPQPEPEPEPEPGEGEGGEG